MKRERTENRLFNAHTGAVAGLVLGIVLGSLLLNLADTGAPGQLFDNISSAATSATVLTRS
jgi:hypothetical protein